MFWCIVRECEKNLCQLRRLLFDVVVNLMKAGESYIFV